MITDPLYLEEIHAETQCKPAVLYAISNYNFIRSINHVYECMTHWVEKRETCLYANLAKIYSPSTCICNSFGTMEIRRPTSPYISFAVSNETSLFLTSVFPVLTRRLISNHVFYVLTFAVVYKENYNDQPPAETFT